jgi:SPX domain protein involved in polyphosphate accumulation
LKKIQYFSMSTSEFKYRYELKYPVDPDRIDSLYWTLKTHSAGFRLKHPDRKINNIYFDNVMFNYATDNLFGISDRIKYRYRWYNGIENFSKGILEKKIKKNALGSKAYHDPGAFDNPVSLAEWVKDNIPDKVLNPSLVNSYLRSYYLDYTGRFRLTLDRELRYVLPSEDGNFDSNRMISDKRIIVEIKFDQAHADQFDAIMHDWPFRLSKHSKYVTGLVSLLY